MLGKKIVFIKLQNCIPKIFIEVGLDPRIFSPHMRKQLRWINLTQRFFGAYVIPLFLKRRLFFFRLHAIWDLHMVQSLYLYTALGRLFHFDCLLNLGFHYIAL